LLLSIGVLGQKLSNFFHFIGSEIENSTNMNDYDAYDDDYVDSSHQNNNVGGSLMNDMLQLTNEHQQPEVDFDDPSIAALPRILLMGPRRAGKTSIQVLLDT
jgi:hypothetical protein